MTEQENKNNDIPDPKIRYDSELQSSYGYFCCPNCGSNCIYNFGSKEIKRIQSGFDSFGFSWLHGAWVELKILRDFGAVVDVQKFDEYRTKLLEVKSPHEAQEDYEVLIRFWNERRSG